MNIHGERIELLRQKMKEAGIGLYYVPMDDCHASEYVAAHFRCNAYLTGFTGSAGHLVVTEGGAWFFTDGRFSFRYDAPLDMRMDRTQYLSAFNVVNEYSVGELTKILWEYGEEKLARRIAENIAEARENKTIATTLDLAKIVEMSYPAKTRWKFGNPCKRTFQAIRIEVNGELAKLSEAIQGMARRLKKGGRIAIITFHSLEDRIVKNVFRELNLECTCPPDFPVCVCGKVKEIELINKKPITASAEELERNPRAESAKLRIAEKI